MNLPTSSIVIDANVFLPLFVMFRQPTEPQETLAKAPSILHARIQLCNPATECMFAYSNNTLHLAASPIFIDMFSIPLPESRGDYDEVRAFAVKVKYQYVDVAFNSHGAEAPGAHLAPRLMWHSSHMVTSLCIDYTQVLDSDFELLHVSAQYRVPAAAAAAWPITRLVVPVQEL
ncbi:hypothetical protein BC826DRAFT_1108179 [Russula brevipes]|nr:hypothetical protein BC826DRAFT_1108179 [Russula brevipes]